MRSSHRRGEHGGYNLLYARSGCPECQADVEDVRRRTAESIEQAVRADLAGRPEDEVEEAIDRVKAIARSEGFL